VSKQEIANHQISIFKQGPMINGSMIETARATFDALKIDH